MGIIIEIPSALKQYVKNQDEVEVTGSSIKEALAGLCSEYDEIKQNIFDEEGNLRSFLNIYINDNDIRYINGMESNLNDGDSIQIVPSVAGGCLSKIIIK